MQNEEETQNTLKISHLQKLQHYEYEHQGKITNVKMEVTEIMAEEKNHYQTDF